MVEVTVRVPEDIKDIIAETSETIYVEALKEVARKRTSNIQRRLKELRIKTAAYEKKYGKSYAEFSQNVPETLKAHDDWIEWSYLVKLADELAYKVEKLGLLLGKGALSGRPRSDVRCREGTEVGSRRSEGEKVRRGQG